MAHRAACARVCDKPEGNGTTFDPQGRLIQCEGGNRRVTRWPADGMFASSDVLMDRFDGKRLSRPNDVVCKSDGSVYFTNPGLRILRYRVSPYRAGSRAGLRAALRAVRGGRA